MAKQAEERDDENEDPEQIVEKYQKRKTGNEEIEIGEQKASNWVSDMVYISWRDKGFNKWISPFQELIESKGWHLFWDHKAPGFIDVVK